MVENTAKQQRKYRTGDLAEKKTLKKINWLPKWLLVSVMINSSFNTESTLQIYSPFAVGEELVLRTSTARTLQRLSLGPQTELCAEKRPPDAHGTPPAVLPLRGNTPAAHQREGQKPSWEDKEPQTNATKKKTFTQHKEFHLTSPQKSTPSHSLPPDDLKLLDYVPRCPPSSVRGPRESGSGRPGGEWGVPVTSLPWYAEQRQSCTDRSTSGHASMSAACGGGSSRRETCSAFLLPEGPPLAPDPDTGEDSPSGDRARWPAPGQRNPPAGHNDLLDSSGAL